MNLFFKISGIVSKSFLECDMERIARDGSFRGSKKSNAGWSLGWHSPSTRRKRGGSFQLSYIHLLHVCSATVVILLLNMQQLFAIIFVVVIIIIISSHNLTWIVDVSDKNNLEFFIFLFAFSNMQLLQRCGLSEF